MSFNLFKKKPKFVPSTEQQLTTEIQNIPQQDQQPIQTQQPLAQSKANDQVASTLKNIMGYAEIIGIDKEEIGRTTLKALLTGKLNYKEPKVQRSPFEKIMQTFYDGWFFWSLLFIMYLVIKYLDHVWK